MVRGGKSGKAAVVGGVGRFSRNPVNRSALLVVEGFLAFGGFTFCCAVVNCATFFFGVAQQRKTFLTFFVVFL